MTDNIPKTPIFIRLISAAVALIGFFCLLHFGGAPALKGLCLVAVVLGTLELNRILFLPGDSRSIRALFFILMLALFGFSVWAPGTSGLAFAFVSILFFSASIWMRHRFNALASLTQFQGKSVLGFFYLGLLPAHGAQILDLPHGQIWFIALLAFVFSGDSLAFFIGLFFGKTPLLPEISPKKTVEGAMGGLVGSLIAGAVMIILWPELPAGPVLTLAGCAGLAGQMGDLFESLLKRVANQKDSGRIMPGHGGILDRLDGVLFAAPIVLIGATLIENGQNLLQR